jgi:pimeloyl-ACP methyl ester carboxylesterase
MANAKLIPPPGRMVDVGGRRLHVNVAGSGSPTVILEAGIAASSLSWALVVNQIAEVATVVTYDRAGFGWSDPASHRCTALDSTQDLALLVDRAEIRGPLLLVGHSFGGLIVRLFEQTYPGRVAGLVLVDPVCRAEWREAGEQRRRMLARGVTLSRRGALLARLGVVGLGLKLLASGSRTIPKMLARVSAGHGAGVTERLTEEVRKMPRELWPAVAAHWSQARCFRAMADSLENLPMSVTQIDETRSLGNLPIIVLSAASASAQAIAEHEHDSRLSARGEHTVVPFSGHWMQLDAPDAVRAAVARVLVPALVCEPRHSHHPSGAA